MSIDPRAHYVYQPLYAQYSGNGSDQYSYTYCPSTTGHVLRTDVVQSPKEGNVQNGDANVLISKPPGQDGDGAPAHDIMVDSGAAISHAASLPVGAKPHTIRRHERSKSVRTPPRRVKSSAAGDANVFISNPPGQDGNDAPAYITHAASLPVGAGAHAIPRYERSQSVRTPPRRVKTPAVADGASGNKHAADGAHEKGPAADEAGEDAASDDDADNAFQQENSSPEINADNREDDDDDDRPGENVLPADGVVQPPKSALFRHIEVHNKNNEFDNRAVPNNGAADVQSPLVIGNANENNPPPGPQIANNPPVVGAEEQAELSHEDHIERLKGIISGINGLRREPETPKAVRGVLSDSLARMYKLQSSIAFAAGGNICEQKRRREYIDAIDKNLQSVKKIVDARKATDEQGRVITDEHREEIRDKIKGTYWVIDEIYWDSHNDDSNSAEAENSKSCCGCVDTCVDYLNDTGPCGGCVSISQLLFGVAVVSISPLMYLINEYPYPGADATMFRAHALGFSLTSLVMLICTFVYTAGCMDKTLTPDNEEREKECCCTRQNCCCTRQNCCCTRQNYMYLEENWDGGKLRNCECFAKSYFCKECCYQCGDTCVPSICSVLYNFLLPMAQIASAIVVVYLAANYNAAGIEAKHWAVFAAAVVVFLKAIIEDASAA